MIFRTALSPRVSCTNISFHGRTFSWERWSIDSHPGAASKSGWRLQDAFCTIRTCSHTKCKLRSTPVDNLILHLYSSDCVVCQGHSWKKKFFPHITIMFKLYVNRNVSEMIVLPWKNTLLTLIAPWVIPLHHKLVPGQAELWGLWE